MNLQTKIAEGTARVCVIGLGYVGLPLAVGFARMGFPVVGLDVDERKITALRQGKSYIRDVESNEVAALVSSGKLTATSDYEVLRQVDVVFICVPTPFDAMKAPDLSFILSAAEGILPRLQVGQLIILQSTTYPGTTEEVVLPILERSGLKAGQDFHLAFSPERINPGDKTYSVHNTPKVVGGLTPRCTELARALLSHLFSQVYVVSSPRTAEMTKLLENIFRSVNIALVNELALLSERMGIDFWEVIAAASTKPFGFMPFYPGPGVGGHCIPVDPYYLSWKAREYDFYTKFIELAAEVNQDMPYHVVEKVAAALSDRGHPLRGARVLVLGVAFKRDIDDARNSPAERIIELLLDRGAEVQYNDPYVPRFRVGRDVFWREERVLESIPLTEEILRTSDVVLIIAGHTVYDYGWIVDQAPLVVDTVNVTRAVASRNAKVVRIGAPMPR
ncbi:MAG: nucleotide sugar dehydrogenase [Anaerolineae bacterium]|nr:nucleotide sugar dehydrogenase [Anaerolineae bacterium]MDH7474912.1 nucleotide sugar dehydrogenase [Anaerolineae bacterium]